MARSLEHEERVLMGKKEREEFKRLQAQFGFEKGKNIARQSDANLCRSVQQGKMSAVDYHEKRIMLRMSERNGIDDGSSATQGYSVTDDTKFLFCVHYFEIYWYFPDISSQLKKLSAISGTMWICSTLDHYASSFGDQGWGCGYR